MNEFIEKLIGRLEEEKVRSEEKGKSVITKEKIPHEYEFFMGESVECERIISIVNELAEEYKGGWIPCSERLPEEMQTVIFSTEEGMVEAGWYDANKNWCVNDSYFPNAFEFIAWMPLPDPYIRKG